MRTCSYCGKEYPDDVAQCAVDGTSLPADAPPVLIPPLLPPKFPTNFPASVRGVITDRQLQIVELVLVCVVSVGGSLFLSVGTLFGWHMTSYRGSFHWAYGILNEVTSLALLWYVLLRRSRSFSDLGLGWSWTNIGWSIALCFGAYVAYRFVYAAFYYSGLGSAQHGTASVSQYLFGSGIFITTLVFQCINPFFEELIVRAYLMTEVRQFSNSAVAAVVCSTVLQTGYHLYQGIPLAFSAGAMFLFWSVYYAKTNRIMPVILAHFYFDAGATLSYFIRHY